MKSIKIMFLILASIVFAFIITQQRLESKSYDNSIRSLEREIELINSKKRETHIAIERELQRIAVLNSENYGVPISLNDIIRVEIAPLTDSDYFGESAEFNSHLNSLVYRITQTFSEIRNYSSRQNLDFPRF
jgi:hypothetical protein